MAAYFAHVCARRRHQEVMPRQIWVLVQELGGSGAVGRLIAAIAKAGQSKETIGKWFVFGCRSAWAPGAGGHDLDVPSHPSPAGEAVFPSQDQLGCGKWERLGSWRCGVPSVDSLERGWCAVANGALKLTSLRAELV
jgi:hypothetical protein